jgi:hypothetical protein
MSLRKSRRYVSSSVAKIILVSAVMFLSGCEESNFVYPEGYAPGKWSGGVHQGIHETLTKNNIADCASDNEKSGFYSFKENKNVAGEYLVDCRSKWQSIRGVGPVYKVDVEKHEVVKVY